MSMPPIQPPPVPAYLPPPIPGKASEKKFSDPNFTVKNNTILYNKKYYKVIITDENGKTTDLTDPNELNRIIKILVQAQFHTTKQDLTKTTISNDGSDCHVKLNGNEVKVTNQQRVNEIFHKMFPSVLPPKSLLEFEAVNDTKNTSPSENIVHAKQKIAGHEVSIVTGDVLKENHGGAIFSPAAANFADLPSNKVLYAAVRGQGTSKSDDMDKTFEEIIAKEGLLQVNAAQATSAGAMKPAISDIIHAILPPFSEKSLDQYYQSLTDMYEAIFFKAGELGVKDLTLPVFKLENSENIDPEEMSQIQKRAFYAMTNALGRYSIFVRERDERVVFNVRFLIPDLGPDTKNIIKPFIEQLNYTARV